MGRKPNRALQTGIQSRQKKSQAGKEVKKKQHACMERDIEK